MDTRFELGRLGVQPGPEFFFKNLGCPLQSILSGDFTGMKARADVNLVN